MELIKVMEEHKDIKTPDARPAFIRIAPGSKANDLTMINNTVIGDADFLDIQGELNNTTLKGNKHVVPDIAISKTKFTAFISTFIGNWHTTWWGILILTIVSGLIVVIISYFVFGIGRSSPSIEHSNLTNSPIFISSPSSTVNYLEGKDSLLREYTYVASMYPMGSTILVGDGLTNNNELLRGTYEVINNKLVFKCDENSLKVYQDMIEKEPRFPFSYYAMAVCKRTMNDVDWVDYATKAVDILKMTTQIDGHKQEHDQALRILQDHLKGVEL